MNKSQLARFFISVFLGLSIALSPPPEGLQAQAWQLLGIFVFTISMVILDALPMGIATLMGICACVFFKVLPFSKAFSGYSSEVVWLVFCAFFISHGFIQTGLGRRMAYGFIALLGRSTLGLGYGVALTELVLAPAIPSVTARSGAIVYPIVQALAHAFHSRPEDHTQKRVGSYLILVAFQATVITSAMFVTAMASNSLCLKLAAQASVNLSIGLWALYASVPGILSLMIMPKLLFYLEKPKLTHTPEAVQMAKEELKRMGPLSTQEKIMLVTFLGVLLAWILGSIIGISAVMAAFLALIFLIITGVLKWGDLLKLHQAVDTFVWFGALVALSESLADLGLATWFGAKIAFYLGGVSPIFALLGLFLVYFYLHYFFAGNTSHIGALYLPFLMVALGLGAPPVPTALALGFCSNLFGGLTHYGCGPAPILFGAGYVDVKQWWKVGFLMSILNLTIFLGVGSIWWGWLLSA